MSKNPIYVIVGNERSGSHMVARTCGMAPNVKTNIEEGPIWTYSLALARNPGRLNFLGPKLVDEYKKHQDKPYIFVDKSNPNHFIADYLKTHIPEMKFIVLFRSMEGNVCSQLRRTNNYERIMGDTLYYGFPAPFYGLTTWDYYSWSFIERLCHRWFVNRKVLEAVVNTYENDTESFHYHDFTLGKTHLIITISRLNRFLHTSIPTIPSFYEEGNHDNWMWNLTIDQKAFINDYFNSHEEELYEIS